MERTGLLHVDEVDLVLPVARLHRAHVHHVRVRDVLLVALLNDVGGRAIIVMEATVVLVLPDELPSVVPLFECNAIVTQR